MTDMLLAFTSVMPDQMSSQNPSVQAAEPSWGSTVLVDGTPASSVSGTVVVGQSLRPGDSIMRRGSEGLPGGYAGGTMVEQRGSSDGADYLAALGAAASHDRGCGPRQAVERECRTSWSSWSSRTCS